MACRLILVRHGQSEGNLINTFLGHTDLELSDLGKKQAELTAVFLKQRQIDKIYSSDLKRAYQTSLPLANYKNIIPEKSQSLREIFAGRWENRSFSELIEEFGESYGKWRNNIGFAHPVDGESVLELQERIIKEVERIAKENDGKTVAVFTHATPIRTFFAFVRGYSAEQIKDLPWATNASVSEVFYENGKFSEISYSRDDFLLNLTTALPESV